MLDAQQRENQLGRKVSRRQTDDKQTEIITLDRALN